MQMKLDSIVLCPNDQTTDQTCGLGPMGASCCLSDSCSLFDSVWLLICSLGHVVQIRVHLAHAGYAIIGDDVYGLQVTSLRQDTCVYILYSHYSTAKSADVSEQHCAIVQPFVQSDLFSCRTQGPWIGRQALHAASLSIQHPCTGDKLQLIGE